jgi:tRNA(Ile2) C34 agmatinyltransferase TiaS
MWNKTNKKCKLCGGMLLINTENNGYRCSKCDVRFPKDKAFVFR